VCLCTISRKRDKTSKAIRQFELHLQQQQQQQQQQKMHFVSATHLETEYPYPNYTQNQHFLLSLTKSCATLYGYQTL
jgi:hypothetical protein